MSAEGGIVAGERMFDSLPDVFRASDESGDLARLLGVFEALFFGAAGGAPSGLPGIERCLPAIPAVFAPLGSAADPAARTPDAFLPWLASWLAFTPRALFAPAALRRIVAGIVPLYGLRGTRDYLARLLALCFDDVGTVHVDDRPRVGLTIGSSRLGTDSRLAQGRAFLFRVVVQLKTAADGEDGGIEGLERRVRAVVDFAKPAHTVYDLVLKPAA